MSPLQGLVIQLLLETLPFIAHGTPQGCLPVWCHHGFGGRASGWPQSRGRLTHFIPQVPHKLVFGPSFRGPVSLWILLWALLPAFPSFSLTPSRNVCAQQRGKQETARSIMLGNIHYCSRCLSVTMSKALGIWVRGVRRSFPAPGGVQINLTLLLNPPLGQVQHYTHQLKPNKSLD